MITLLLGFYSRYWNGGPYISFRMGDMVANVKDSVINSVTTQEEVADINSAHLSIATIIVQGKVVVDDVPVEYIMENGEVIDNRNVSIIQNTVNGFVSVDDEEDLEEIEDAEDHLEVAVRSRTTRAAVGSVPILMNNIRTG